MQEQIGRQVEHLIAYHVVKIVHCRLMLCLLLLLIERVVGRLRLAFAARIAQRVHLGFHADRMAENARSIRLQAVSFATQLSL